jgi:hypothetical protein
VFAASAAICALGAPSAQTFVIVNATMIAIALQNFGFASLMFVTLSSGSRSILACYHFVLLTRRFVVHYTLLH